MSDEIMIKIGEIDQYVFDDKIAISLTKIINKLNRNLTTVAKRMLENQMGTPIFNAVIRIPQNHFEIRLGESLLFSDHDAFCKYIIPVDVTGKGPEIADLIEKKIIQICLNRMSERANAWSKVVSIKKNQKMMLEPKMQKT